MEFTGERMIPERNRNWMYAEHVARYIFASQFVKGKAVLDIACGVGYGANLFSNKGASKVFGVDISKEAIDYAKEKYGKKNIGFVLGDAEKIPLPDNSVDVVVSFETIEHLKNYQSFLKEIKRVLRKDGLAIISTPNKETYPPGNIFHIKEFSLEEFETMLQSHFKKIVFFYQDNWVSSYIFEPRFEFEGKLETSSRVELNAPFEYEKEGLYVIAICCDKDPPAFQFQRNIVLSSEDVLGMFKEIEEGRLLTAEKERLEKHIEELERSLDSQGEMLEVIRLERDGLREQLNWLYGLKTVRFLRFFYRIGKALGRSLGIYKEK